MSQDDDKFSSLRTLIIVPAHNEAQSIATAIRDLQTHVPWADVVVVDDGSSDQTRSVAESCGVTVLKLPCNLGVGGAVQTGYMFAARNGYDVAVQFDGDAQHRAEDIPALIEPLLDDRADLVVGSRLLSNQRDGFEPLRFVGSRVLSLLVSAILHKRITDPTSGFRAASAKTIRFFSRHYPLLYLADTTEALVWASRSGLRITEVPIVMRPRKAGRSATGTIKGVAHVVRIILALLVDCLERPIEDPENLQ